MPGVEVKKKKLRIYSKYTDLATTGRKH